MIVLGGLLYGAVIPGPSRMAESDGFCHGRLPYEHDISAGGDLRAVQSTTQNGGWNSYQHCGRTSPFLANEFHYFLARARGSLVEVETQLMIAQKLTYFSPEHGKDLLDKSAELGKILNGLIGAIRPAA
jgi:four helix bundle protein